MDLVVYLSASVFLLKLDKSSCEDWCTRLMVQGAARGTWLPRGAPGYQVKLKVQVQSGFRPQEDIPQK